MAIATSMKELAEDILTSCQERAGKLTELKEETRVLRQEATGMVKDFSTSRHEASRQLRRQLAQSNTERTKQVRESQDDARNLIKGLRASRDASGAQLRKVLAQRREHLVQSEKKRQQEVRDSLDDFRNSRCDTSAQLRSDLAMSRSNMKSEVKDMLAGAEALISGCQSSRRTMGARLRNNLATNRDERRAEVRVMRDGFGKVQAEVRADLKEASDAWRGMDSAIHAKKSGGKTSPEVQVKRAGETAPDLKEKLLSIINQHAGGITLSEAAETLGLARIVLGKAVKTLQEQGKVRREEKLYFPVTTQGR